MSTSLRDRIAAYDKAAADAAADPGPVPPARATGCDGDGGDGGGDDATVSPPEGASRPSSPVALPASPDVPAASPVASPASPASSASSILSPASDAPSSASGHSPAAAAVAAVACRPNEHLAILVPRDLWKPDRLAARCDKYACRIKFSLFERRHHCRKCGGVFCQACSARTTPLLDTTRLPFLLPPRNTPITRFAAPHAPVLDARVCDDCFDQIHGFPTPRPVTPPTAPLALSPSSLASLTPATPPDGRALPLARPAKPRRRAPYWPPPPVVKTTKLEGDLDRYPLKDPSATCKAAGGGRWEPKHYPPRWDGRLPDGRIRYQAEAERIEEAERRRRANPVIVDGEIRVRKPRPLPPPARGGPYKLPTF